MGWAGEQQFGNYRQGFTILLQLILYQTTAPVNRPLIMRGFFLVFLLPFTFYLTRGSHVAP
jgi:hypothetical protein